jgi:hypothetical protein
MTALARHLDDAIEQLDRAGSVARPVLTAAPAGAGPAFFHREETGRERARA